MEKLYLSFGDILIPLTTSTTHGDGVTTHTLVTMPKNQLTIRWNHPYRQSLPQKNRWLLKQVYSVYYSILSGIISISKWNRIISVSFYCLLVGESHPSDGKYANPFYNLYNIPTWQYNPYNVLQWGHSPYNYYTKPHAMSNEMETQKWEKSTFLACPISC